MFFTDQPVETGLAKQHQRGLIQFVFIGTLSKYFIGTEQAGSQVISGKPAAGVGTHPLKVNHPVFQFFFKHFGCWLR